MSEAGEERHYVLYAAPKGRAALAYGNSEEMLMRWNSRSIHGAIDLLPGKGQVCLEICNNYSFGKLPTDKKVDEILFSEQSALKRMRKPENVTSEVLSDYRNDRVFDFERNEVFCLFGVSETDVEMTLHVRWDGSLDHTLILSGRARRVKKLAHKVVV